MPLVRDRFPLLERCTGTAVLEFLFIGGRLRRLREQEMEARRTQESPGAKV